jgi:hypothetical protein
LFELFNIFLILEEMSTSPSPSSSSKEDSLSATPSSHNITQLRSGPKPVISPSSINKLPSLTTVINTMNAAAANTAAATSSSSSSSSASYSMANSSNKTTNHYKTSPTFNSQPQKKTSNTNYEVII